MRLSINSEEDITIKHHRNEFARHSTEISEIYELYFYLLNTLKKDNL